MLPPVACIMCMVPPEAQQFAIPLAQATVIAAPILLRDNVRRGWGALRRRRARQDLQRVVDAAPRETPPDR